MSRKITNLSESIFLRDYPTSSAIGAGIGVRKVDATNRTTLDSTTNVAWKPGLRNEQFVKRLRQRFDYGSSFTLERSTISNLSHPMHSSGKPVTPLELKYTGPWLPGPSDLIKNKLLDMVPWPKLSDADVDLFGLGGTAISKTLPTRSHMSLGVALGELRAEGLPTMAGLSVARNPNLKGSSSEYLNYQFGIAPLISDIRALLVAVRDSSRIIDEYNRMSKKHIRRGYKFTPINKAFDEKVTIGVLPADTYLWSGNVTQAQLSGSYKSEAWFSGAYTYLIPDGSDLVSKLKKWESEANRLLGLRITPEMIWNLSAWTWLYDWFLTIGNVVTNLSTIGQDGLVLHYGYIMRHTEVTAKVSSIGRPLGASSPASYDFVLSQKLRRKATPYGFGINTSSLTAKQWSILGALGMTRAPGRL